MRNCQRQNRMTQFCLSDLLMACVVVGTSIVFVAFSAMFAGTLTYAARFRRLHP